LDKNENNGNSNGIPCNMIHYSLNVHANELNRKTIRFLNNKHQSLIKIQEENRTKFSGKLTNVQVALKDLLNLKKEVDRLIKDNETLLIDNVKMQQSIDESNVTLEKSEREVDTQRRMLLNYRDQLDFFRKELQNIKSIFLRQDVGQEKQGVPVFGQKFYRFNSLIGMEEEEFKNSTILVIRSEPNDQTLRGYIGNNDSLVPKSIETIRECTLDFVLYSNALNINNNGLKIQLNYNIREKNLHVICECSVPFKLLIYTTVNFDETSAAQVLVEYYSKSVNQCEAKITDLQRDLEVMKKKKLKNPIVPLLIMQINSIQTKMS